MTDPDETAAHAEVLVNPTPGNISVGLLRSIGAPALAGTPLIDVGVGMSDRLAGPSTVFLHGDDTEAKRATGDLLTDIGGPPESQLDIGGITSARGLGHFAFLFMRIAHGLGSHTFHIQVVAKA